MDMFCRQCEQTYKGQGCNLLGVCGKKPEVATLQDLLVYSLEAIAFYAKRARPLGIREQGVDLFVIKGLFTTVTNVNFDAPKIAEIIYQAYEIKEKIRTRFLKAYKDESGKDFSEEIPSVAQWKPEDSLGGLFEQGKMAGILADLGPDEDIRSLREILLYGLKGMAAYADHAYILGEEDEDVNAFFHTALDAMHDASLTADDYLSLIMEFGKVNLRCLEILDRGHTKRFGNPVPTKVSLGIKKGPAIIVSGHDLEDLRQLLEQTEGTGVNIYTHGEMLPAHGYPELKKHKHLTGHFGTAWQNQQREFDGIPAVVLMTTNCIQEPRVSYKDRIFTTGLVAWPEVEHIDDAKGKKDFCKVISRAKQRGGFTEQKEDKEILVGFGHDAVLSSADAMINAVKSGAVRRFFLIGGCDGAKPGRNYFTEFAQKVPKDCMILTLACGKFRFNRLDFGNIGDFPRLLDCGQCNDAYSAIKIASALADAFDCGVNDLPLSLVLSWYEQKAVCILLTLFYLGIKNIRLGPSLPAFVSPNVLKVLVEKFNIKPITRPEDDLRDILEPASSTK